MTTNRPETVVEIALEPQDLKRVFIGSAVLSAAVSLLSYFQDPDWATKHAVYATLAWFNWFALSKVLLGITERRVGDLVMGLMIKPLLLVTLLIVAKYMGIEISAFLLALNTFFLTLFAFMISKGLKTRLMPPMSRAEN